MKAAPILKEHLLSHKDILKIFKFKISKKSNFKSEHLSALEGHLNNENAKNDLKKEQYANMFKKALQETKLFEIKKFKKRLEKRIDIRKYKQNRIKGDHLVSASLK